MKRYWLLAACLIAAAGLFWSGPPAQARVTGTSVPTPADIWCVGESGREVCVDGNGAFYPTTDNDVSVGTTSLRWSDIRSYDMTLTDEMTANGKVTSGNASNDILTVNAGTVAVRANIEALQFSTATTGGVVILHLDGANQRVSVGDDRSPDGVLEVVPQAADTYSLRVSSQNGSTDVLAVDASGAQHDVELSVPLALFSRTRAQIDTLAADSAGQIIYCSDCSVANVCVSTGTAAAQWLRVDSTTIGCGTNN